MSLTKGLAPGHGCSAEPSGAEKRALEYCPSHVCTSLLVVVGSQACGVVVAFLCLIINCVL